MNRREFVKLVSSVVLVPSLGGAVAFVDLPKHFRYKGFEIRIDEVTRPYGVFRQVYGRKGDWCAALLFDRRDSLPKIEKTFEKWLDNIIRRAA